jgi:hypothetical protein
MALLTGNDQILHAANWVRPSLHRVDRAAEPDRPPAGLLDLICAPPYVGVQGYHAGVALSKLAALIRRKDRALARQRQSSRPLQQQHSVA